MHRAIRALRKYLQAPNILILDQTLLDITLASRGILKTFFFDQIQKTLFLAIGIIWDGIQDAW